MSERPKFHPHETYRDFHKQIPTHPIGFRGQPAEFMEATVQNGFDKPRIFVVMNLHENWSSWRKMRKNRRILHESLRTPLYHGHTMDEDTKRLKTVGEAFDYYQDHPEKYSSLLILNFKGLRGWWYTSFPISTGEWNKKNCQNR